MIFKITMISNLDYEDKFYYICDVIKENYGIY